MAAFKPKPHRFPIPIGEGARIASRYGYDQVIIYARKTGENGGEHMTTWGVNVEHCESARLQARALQKFMGWEETV